MQQFLTQPILSVKRLINAACSFAFCRTWLETGLHHSDVRPSLRSSTATAVSNRHRFASSSILSGGGEESWRRRPIAVLTILLVATTLGTLTHLSGFTPWSPRMNASSGDSVPQQFLHGSTALERQGALAFQVKQCRNCHSLGESVGQRGPDQDSVAVRLTQDKLIRQVIQGGGNMPAYGKNLSPAETTALVAFLETLHPVGQTPAHNVALDHDGSKN
jgi:cytochrome c5